MHKEDKPLEKIYDWEDKGKPTRKARKLQALEQRMDTHLSRSKECLV
jgi:hypothetical protein